MTVASFFDKYFGVQKVGQSVPSGAVLRLTDGEVTISLADPASGWYLLADGWAINETAFKKGGAYADNQAADAQFLKHVAYDNVIETLRLGLTFNSPDDLTFQMEKMRNLLKVRAPRYWTMARNFSPVYLEMSFAGGSEAYFALISQGNIRVAPNIFDIYCTLASGKMWPIGMTLSRQPFWLRAIPGETQGAINFSSLQAWNYNLSWSVNSSVPAGQVFCFVEANDGTIYAGGASEILEFDGTTWSVSTTAPVTVSADVPACAKLNNGDILFGESGRILKLSSAGVWSVETTEPTGAIWAILESSAGEVYAGDTGRIIKRNISGVWAEDSTLPAGQVYSLLETASGFTLAGSVGQILRTVEASTQIDFESTVNQSSDDAEQTGTAVILTSSGLDFFTPDEDYIGIRFQNVTIPAGATINSAVIRFTASLTRTNATVGSIAIHCEDEDDASTFTTASNNISSRSLTTASTTWQDEVIWFANQTYDSPDFSEAVQEVIDRGGWASGNALAAIFVASISVKRRRAAWSYDGKPGSAPELIITYTEATVGATWELISTLPTGNVQALLDVTSRIIAADSSQFLSSTDEGVSWGVLDTTPTGQVLSLFDTGVDDTLYAGENGSILKSTDDGLSWNIDDNSTPAGDIEDFILDGSDIYAADDGQILSQDSANSLSLGQSATDQNNVFLANHHKTANLTDVFIDDGGAFTSIFPIVTFPQTLLPVTPVVNDALYLGIDTSLDDTGPFSSVIFDLATPASSTTSYTIVWEYWNGAWVSLTVKDETSQLSGPGVAGLFWEQPSDWATTTVNGVTGYWIRGRVSALTGTLTPPTQQNRDLYSVILPFAEVSASEIDGMIDALVKMQINNRSAAGPPGGSSPLLYQNQFWLGVKGVVGHENFRAFLNFADEQNPAGVTVDVSVDADSATSVEADSNLSSATGRRVFFDAGIAAGGAGLDNMADRVTISLSTTVASSYYGAYRVMIRCKQQGGSAGEVSMRVEVVFGSGGSTALTDTQKTQTTDDNHLILFDQPINLPINNLLTDTEVGDEIGLTVQISVAASDADLYLYDLFLLPTDFRFVDSRDLRNNASSSVENQKRLLVDSITIPKTTIRTLVQDTASGAINASWRVDSQGPMVLPVDDQVRVWVLSGRTISTADSTLISQCEAVYSVRGWKVERE
jgi:hypothetical protein